MPRLSHLLGCAVLLAASALTPLACGSAVADDAVLLASTVPGYVPGMVVAYSDRLSLPDGATVTLLFKSGEVLRLLGPFEGTLEQQQAAAGSGSVAMLADMFRTHGIDAAVIGGTRSVGSARSGPGLDDVQVDPQHSGTYCVEPSTSVWIGRPTGGDGSYAVRRKGSSRTITWPPGATRSEWPGDVPIEDGSQFEITAGGAARATVTFRAMPSAPASAAGKVAEGIILGCREQFEGELRRISRSTIGPALWITTDHGRRPTYNSGDPVALTIMSDVDGYLYCVAQMDGGRDGNGTAPIFPAGAVDGAQLRGAEPLSIPGRRQPIGLTAATGPTQIHCWLADRDITAELPHALLGTPAGRLPDQLAGELDSIFSRVAGSHVATDVLTIGTK